MVTDKVYTDAEMLVFIGKKINLNKWYEYLGIESKNGLHSFRDAMMIKQLVCFRPDVKSPFAEEVEMENEKIQKELENMKRVTRLNPAITDLRCYDPYFWPDVVPECFKEMDKEKE